MKRFVQPLILTETEKIINHHQFSGHYVVPMNIDVMKVKLFLPVIIFPSN